MKVLRLLLRFFFRHFYTDLAWTYDAIAALVSVGQWNGWVQMAAETADQEPVLEVGHGPGHLLNSMAGAGRSAIGIDESRQMTRLASRRLGRNGHPGQVVQARAQALPFPAECFGSLVATFPTEFILDPTTLAEARRTLQVAGNFVIVPVAKIKGVSIFDRMAAWLLLATKQSGDLPSSWSQPIERAGFRLLREELDLGRSTVTRLTCTKISQTMAEPRPRVAPG